VLEIRANPPLDIASQLVARYAVDFRDDDLQLPAR
jgi:hypothetical protein